MRTINELQRVQFAKKFRELASVMIPKKGYPATSSITWYAHEFNKFAENLSDYDVETGELHRMMKRANIIWRDIHGIS